MKNLAVRKAFSDSGVRVRSDWRRWCGGARGPSVKSTPGPTSPLLLMMKVMVMMVMMMLEVVVIFDEPFVG